MAHTFEEVYYDERQLSMYADDGASRTRCVATFDFIDGLLHLDGPQSGMAKIETEVMNALRPLFIEKISARDFTNQRIRTVLLS